MRKNTGSVIQARNACDWLYIWMNINAQIQAENQLQKHLRSIFALSEAYPDLKAILTFFKLQDKLELK